MAAARIIRRLAELLDVSVSSPADGDVLTYDSGTSKWRNEAAAAGGGSTPSSLLRGTFHATHFDTSVANGAIAPFSWIDNESDGGPVVDLTDPEQPAVLVDGVYAVAVTAAAADAMTADGYYQISLQLDYSGEGVVVAAIDSRLATAAQPYPQVDLGRTYYIPAGGTIRCQVRNRDGANTISFGLDLATIQQVA